MYDCSVSEMKKNSKFFCEALFCRNYEWWTSDPSY